jgi:hypothetical protein
MDCHFFISLVAVALIPEEREGAYPYMQKKPSVRE